jgi:hypothetical protein
MVSRFYNAVKDLDAIPNLSFIGWANEERILMLFQIDVMPILKIIYFLLNNFDEC